MSNIQLQRNADGSMRMVVGDRIAMGAKVAGIQAIEGLGLTAIVWVPLRETVMSEADNVVPLMRKAS